MRRWLMHIVAHVRRWEVLAAVALAALWVPVFVIHPMITYRDGTARDVSVHVVAEPYAQSPVLTYRWSGDVYRSCEISLRRAVIDSTGQVHTLVDTPILAPVPRDDLGRQEYAIDVPVGPNLAAGPAVYLVREVPRCTWLQRLWPVSVDYPPVEFTVTRKDKT